MFDSDGVATSICHLCLIRFGDGVEDGGIC